LVLCGFLVGATAARLEPVHAIEAFKNEFMNKYVKKDSTDPNEKAFAAAATNAKCMVCHVGPTNKKNRNAYGRALDELLDKKADAKNSQKIQDALKTVEGKKSNRNNPNSPTFGENIKQGKLPAD
jgi:hypothetical protein